MPPDVTSRQLVAADAPSVSQLHARVFGPGRFARSAYRVREGTPEVSAFCRGAFKDGRLIAALRMTEVSIGGTPGALLLGPLAVDPAYAGQGFGRALIAEALDAARTKGKRLVVLVGDLPYYGRFGFQAVPPGQIRLPGPVNPARILAAELAPDVLGSYRGLVAAR
jgi:predicted N-acetyltransferase YhbS